MRNLFTQRLLTVCAAVAALLVWASAADSAAERTAEVILERVPNGGIQPRVILDKEDKLHLIYFEGEAKAGDLFYVWKKPGASAFSDPIRVNSVAKSAVASGTIRGGQIAVGKDDRIHAVWNGSQETREGPHGAPLFYTHLKAEGTSFVPQRNIITWAHGLDGGAAVAAEGSGHVYVVWHARGSAEGEAARAVYLAHSTDQGETFSRETRANPQPTGACACCQLQAMAGENGSLYIAYRAAREAVHRDTILLRSVDYGASFQGESIHPWDLRACPMSSFSLATGPGGPLVAWETAGQVYHATINGGALSVSGIVAAPGKGPRRKHPVLACNKRGETLLAWTEGTSFGKGGFLCWQAYDVKGNPTSTKGRMDGVPRWSLAAAYANPDGDFVIVY